ncbi:MAG: hypothetical protein EU530_00240 [Promethearchaeota archaeon]|nr:MAG: hypothetical protein EU530_00240 [Candidatus Lokiarchaeota archaeon]
MNTKKKTDSQKEQLIVIENEDLLTISDEVELEENDLSYLNQPTLIIVKNRKRIIKKKHLWVVPL